jgi:hypothetical protein
MNISSSIRVASVVAIAVLVACGFWLGAFAWFGGFVWVKQALGCSALTIGLVVAVFRWRATPRRWPWHTAFFFGSQLVFAAAVAAGQVFYVGPSSASEAAHLFGIAMQGGL